MTTAKLCEKCTKECKVLVDAVVICNKHVVEKTQKNTQKGVKKATKSRVI